MDDRPPSPATQRLLRDLELQRAFLEIQNREMKEAQRLFEISRNQFASLYDYAPVGYLTFGATGVIQECNLKAAILLHVDRIRLSGQLVGRWIFPDDRAIFSDYLGRCLRSDEPSTEVCELRLRPVENEEPRFVQLHTIGVRDPRSNERVFRCAIIDISDRRRADDAEAASLSKSSFLANMSHEIRTPLGAMLGFIKLLKDPACTREKREKYLNVIERNASILSRLIDDILDLSKVEANRLDIEKIEFSLDQLLTELEELFSLKAGDKHLEFSIVRRKIPQRIISDPLRVKQVLINIVGNAIKFTEKGKVVMTVDSPDVTSGILTFTVLDTGRAIPAEKRGKLFKNFSQADNSTTRQFGGTGLGLALSRKLAQALGGDVVLDDRPGQPGNQFTVTLQVGIPKRRALLVQTFSEPPQPESTADLAGVSVLVAEDSLDNQFLIEHLLNTRGAKVKFAENGLEAVETALNQSYDLVLMDVQMPVMDGHEATRRLRDRGYHVPIIALSAHAMKEDRERSLLAGCDEHLTKPIDVGRLVDVIRRYTHPPSSQPLPY